MHLNYYDKEKYTVNKALQEGKMDVEKEVDQAWDTIIGEVSGELINIPEIARVIKDHPEWGPGTKSFKDVMSLSFYPKYAEDFFREVPDSKLAMKGEISEPFKDWLKEKFMKEGLNEEDAIVAMDNTLSDPSTFEAQYPEISKKIGDILEKYNNVDGIKTVQDAVLTTMARHMMQRGSSGQRIASAKDGFSDVTGLVKKMKRGFQNYKDIYKRNKGINIYNMDGKEFIAKMGEKFNGENAIIYNDPPYIRTTKTYIKNQEGGELTSLGEYTDYGKLKEIFRPMEKAVNIFTNDIDGKYLESLKELFGKRLSPEVLGYVEGTTPTSLINTIEVENTPRELRLPYYKVIRSQKISDIARSLQESFLPKISAEMEKELSKLIRAYQEKSGEYENKLLQIMKGQENAKVEFSKLKEAIEEVTTGRDKQVLLQEAYRLTRYGNLAGKDLVNMIKTINKLWEDRQELIRSFRKKYNEFLGSNSVDVNIKDEYRKEFEAMLTDKKVTLTDRKNVDIVDKGLRGETLDTKEQEVYYKYLFDNDFYEKTNALRTTKSIYEMDIDEIKSTLVKLDEARLLASDQYHYNKRLLGDYVDKLAAHAQATAKQLTEYKELGNPKVLPLRERLLAKRKSAESSIQGVANDFTGANWMINEGMNGEFLKDQIDDQMYEYRNEHKTIHDREVEIAKRNKLSEQSFWRISQHALATMGDGK